MTDIETLGTDSDSTIIQISAVAFDITTGETKDYFNQIVNIERNEGDLKVTARTIKWWLNSHPELLVELLNKGELSSEEVLNNFYEWLGQFEVENTYLWGNGILFDNKMIQHQFEAIGLSYPIHYRNDRDVRTILELAAHKLGVSEKEIKNLVNDKIVDARHTPHNALHDCYYQVALVSYCLDILTNGVKI